MGDLIEIGARQPTPVNSARAEQVAARASTEAGAHSPVVAFIASLHNSALTRTTMLDSLDFLAGHILAGARAETVEWHRLERIHVDALVSKLVLQGYAPATINRCLSALRGVVRAAWGLRLLSHEDMERVCAVQGPRNDRPLAGRVLQLDEVRALYDACKRGARPVTCARDAALLTLAYCCGMRRREVSNLPLASVLGLAPPAHGGTPTVSNSAHVVVLGKGRKLRTVFLASAARAHLTHWTALRTAHGGVSADDPNARAAPFLYRLSEHGHCIAPLANTGVYHVLEQLGRRAGVADFSPHDLRRTYITTLLEAGVDVLTVARLAGHEDPKTTAKYDRRGDRALAAAAETLDRIEIKDSAGASMPVVPPP